MVFLGARDSTLGLMIFVMIISVPTTIIYSIYVATENARYRSMIITIMCLTFFAGKNGFIYYPLVFFHLRLHLNFRIKLHDYFSFSSVYPDWGYSVRCFVAYGFLCFLFHGTRYHRLFPIHMCRMHAHT